MTDNKKNLLGIVLYVSCAVFLGAQLKNPMPTPNTPHSFEYYDTNGNGILDYEEMTAYAPGIRDMDGYGDLKLDGIQALAPPDSAANEDDPSGSTEEYHDADEVSFYQWQIFVD